MSDSIRPVRLAYALVAWFAFLGPIGTLIPIPGAPASFRFYYLMLVPGILLFIAGGLRRTTAHALLILSPVVLYMALSSFYTWLYYAGSWDPSEGNPVIRFLLFLVQLMFTICAGAEASLFTPVQKLRVVGLFFRGFFISLFAGYIFLIGMVTHKLSIAFITHFEILVQWGFGFLRFSPGSYPNEYGIVSSFALSVLTLLLVERRDRTNASLIFGMKASLPRLLPAWLLTLGALFMTTTRAAYIAYLVSILYIAASRRRVGRSLLFLFEIIAAGVLLLACVEPFFDVTGVLKGAYFAFFSQDRYASGRLDAWKIAYELFLQHPYWGAGFGSVDMMHNVYLQLFFGMGFIGFTLLLLTWLAFWFRTRGLSFARPERPAPLDSESLLHRIVWIAWLHISWFAMSNHNLNHFLTWFGVLLAMMSYRPAESSGWATAPARELPLESIQGSWRVLPSKGD